MAARPVTASAWLDDVMQWDVATWSQCLPFWTAAGLGSSTPESTTVLTVGERHGGLSLWFAMQGFAVVCTDINGPTPHARRLHETYGVERHIRYASANVLALPFPDATFDIVAAKSVLGGIKPKRRALKTQSLSSARIATQEFHRVLQPGGLFLGAENMAGGLIHRVGRTLRPRRYRRWRYLTQTDLGTLFEPFAELGLDYYGYLGTHWGHARANRWAAQIDRRLCRLLPSASRYVGFIRARK